MSEQTQTEGAVDTTTPAIQAIVTSPAESDPIVANQLAQDIVADSPAAVDPTSAAVAVAAVQAVIQSDAVTDPVAVQNIVAAVNSVVTQPVQDTDEHTVIASSIVANVANSPAVVDPVAVDQAATVVANVITAVAPTVDTPVNIQAALKTDPVQQVIADAALAPAVTDATAAQEIATNIVLDSPAAYASPEATDAAIAAVQVVVQAPAITDLDAVANVVAAVQSVVSTPIENTEDHQAIADTILAATTVAPSVSDTQAAGEASVVISNVIAAVAPTSSEAILPSDDVQEVHVNVTDAVTTPVDVAEVAKETPVEVTAEPIAETKVEEVPPVNAPPVVSQLGINDETVTKVEAPSPVIKVAEMIPVAPIVSTPVKPSEAEEDVKDFSENVAFAIRDLHTYHEKMHPRMPITPEAGERHQKTLYRAIRRIIDETEPSEFEKAFQYLLHFIRKHRETTFQEAYIYRFTEAAPGTGLNVSSFESGDRQAFQSIINLLLLIENPATRPLISRQVDLTKSLASFSEHGRQKVLSFLNA